MSSRQPQTRVEFLQLFPRATESTLIANGFGLASVPDTERKRDQRGESQDRQLDKSKEGVAFCISIISLRRCLVDGHDNFRSGAKQLVDQITSTLGFASDDNPRLHWEYAQFVSKSEGTIVRIEPIAK